MQKNKYIQVIKASLGQELVYKTSFIFTRIRSLLTFFLLFFLWDAVYRSGENVFGISREQMLTYVFGILIVKAIVANSKISSLSGEIASGSLTNYLLKPVSYFKLSFARDIGTKSINLIFAFFEIIFVYLILRPQLFWQTEAISVFLFIVLLGIAVVTYFFLLALVSMVPFWLAEQTWPPVFLFLTISDLMSGAIFPLDILPEYLRYIFLLTPFPYLLYVPLQIYLGRFSVVMVVKYVAVSVFWLLVSFLFFNYSWKKGIKLYRAEGR